MQWIPLGCYGSTEEESLSEPGVGVEGLKGNIIARRGRHALSPEKGWSLPGREEKIEPERGIRWHTLFLPALDSPLA